MEGQYGFLIMMSKQENVQGENGIIWFKLCYLLYIIKIFVF